MPCIFMAFLLGPSSKDGQIFLRFFWELNQDEKLKQSCLNVLHESNFFVSRPSTTIFSENNLATQNSKQPGFLVSMPIKLRRGDLWVAISGETKRRNPCLAHLGQILPKVRCPIFSRLWDSFIFLVEKKTTLSSGFPRHQHEVVINGWLTITRLKLGFETGVFLELGGGWKISSNSARI